MFGRKRSLPRGPRTETFEAYRTRVLSYLGDEEPIGVQQATPSLEDRAFSDPEYLRVVEAVEADLIDAYVRDELQPSERRQFENRFMASAERRKKVEFAKTWARVAGESPAENAVAAKTVVPRTSWQERIARFARGPMPAFRFAMAAAVIILIGVVSWQALQTTKMRGRISELEAERNGRQQQDNELQKAVETERARADELSAQLRQNRPPAGLASLILIPGTVRGDKNARPQLLIPSSAQLAAVKIQLEERDHFPQYRAELRTERGAEVLTRSNLHEQRAGGARYVGVDIPASALSAGNYEITLKGITGDKLAEDIGYYRFSVQKK